ncbi:M23 family metallopeptidase [Actinoplanes sp. NPDC051470]|uniref:M23 family metallopeptidase n=1 Tax=Actinoplanes sp. NPDC051470 TaxID=3157224 RepID=UPI00342B1E6C
MWASTALRTVESFRWFVTQQNPKGPRGTGGGYWVRLDHGGRWQTQYLHLLEPPMVEQGQRVQIGQQIGKVGSTGRSGAPAPALRAEDRPAEGGGVLRRPAIGHHHRRPRVRGPARQRELPGTEPSSQRNFLLTPEPNLSRTAFDDPTVRPVSRH